MLKVRCCCCRTWRTESGNTQCTKSNCIENTATCDGDSNSWMRTMRCPSDAPSQSVAPLLSPVQTPPHRDHLRRSPSQVTFMHYCMHCVGTEAGFWKAWRSLAGCLRKVCDSLYHNYIVLCSLYRVHPAGLEVGCTPGCNYADRSSNVLLMFVWFCPMPLFSALWSFTFM